MTSKTLLPQAVILLVLVTSHVWAAKYYGTHKEVCKPWSFNVAVKVEGCQTRTVLLNQCAGTCFTEHSFSGKSCKCCKPVKKSAVKVPLHCKDNPSESPYQYNHSMEQHEECSCLQC